MLARTLCKLCFFNSEKSNDQGNSEDAFRSFVKQEVKDLFFDDDFLVLSLVFFERTKNGMEPSLAIPYTRVMGLLREKQMEIAKEGMKKLRDSLKGTLSDWVKKSDLKKIEKKITKKLRDEVDFMSVTKEKF